MRATLKRWHNIISDDKPRHLVSSIPPSPRSISPIFLVWQQSNSILNLVVNPDQLSKDAHPILHSVSFSLDGPANSSKGVGNTAVTVAVDPQ